MSSEERSLLEAAATLAHTSMSDFIRRRALEAAELELMESRVVTIPAKDWERFEAWADEPPKDVPGLRKLAAVKPSWKR